jgi:hypothetical protein
MTIDEILTLGKMGYTKEEIEALNKPADPEPAKETEPAKEPEPVSEPEPEKEPAADPTKDLLKFMAGEFDKLNKSIQNSNILGSNINQPKAKTAEEVLAELIAPPSNKGGK